MISSVIFQYYRKYWPDIRRPAGRTKSAEFKGSQFLCKRIVGWTISSVFHFLVKYTKHILPPLTYFLYLWSKHRFSVEHLPFIGLLFFVSSFLYVGISFIGRSRFPDWFLVRTLLSEMCVVHCKSSATRCIRWFVTPNVVIDVLTLCRNHRIHYGDSCCCLFSFFYVLWTVHPSSQSLHINPTRCTILLSIFISLLYMFRWTMYPSSGEITVSMRHWYMSLCMSGVRNDISTRRPDATHTEWHIPVSHRYSNFSLWWAHGCPKHVEKWNRYTKQNCVPSWIYLQECRSLLRQFVIFFWVTWRC